jgi:MSHA biogenesis protein MshP
MSTMPLKHCSTTRHGRPQQGGFAAMAALFLIVILAAMAGFMGTFGNTLQLGSAQDIQGTRAYWAARSGLEWAISGVSTSSPAACPSSPTTLPASAANGNFSVTVNCTVSTYTEGAQTVNLFQVSAVASNALSVGSAVYVERSLSAAIER